MPLPSLSVVIPCLDAAATLPGQLAALAAQRYDGDWEVDRRRQRLDRRQLAPSSSRSALACRGSPSSTPPTAAAAPTPATSAPQPRAGDALLFVDADDEVAPGCLAAMGAALAAHDFVACRYDSDTLNPEWARGTHSNPQRDGLSRYDYPDYLPHAGGGGLGVRRAVHAAVGGFDETMPALEDTDYCWRIQRAGHALVFVPDAVVRIRHRHDLRGMFAQGWRTGALQRPHLRQVPPAGHAATRRAAGRAALGQAAAAHAVRRLDARRPLALDLAARLAARAPPRLSALPRRRALNQSRA